MSESTSKTHKRTLDSLTDEWASAFYLGGCEWIADDLIDMGLAERKKVNGEMRYRKKGSADQPKGEAPFRAKCIGDRCRAEDGKPALYVGNGKAIVLKDPMSPFGKTVISDAKLAGRKDDRGFVPSTYDALSHIERIRRNQKRMEAANHGK